MMMFYGRLQSVVQSIPDHEHNSNPWTLPLMAQDSATGLDCGPRLYYVLTMSLFVNRQACLRLVEKRETRYRVQWYYRLFEETQRGLTWGTSVEVVHGSLLALGELLRHTGKLPVVLPVGSPVVSPVVLQLCCNHKLHQATWLLAGVCFDQSL